MFRRFELRWWRLTLVSAALLIGSTTVGRGDFASDTSSRLDIVDRAIAFHGGDRYRHSRTELTLCSGSGCYAVDARIEGGLFDLEVSGPVRDGLRRVRMTNDTTDLWLDGRPVELAADRVQAMRDWAMARIYFVFLPFRLNDPSAVKEDLGREIWAGKELHKVKVTFVAGSSSGAEDTFVYWFDPQSGRLEQFAYSFKGDPGGLRFRRGFNYRRVGGILFFDQENWGKAGTEPLLDQLTAQDVSSWERISTVRLEAISVDSTTASDP